MLGVDFMPTLFILKSVWTSQALTKKSQWTCQEVSVCDASVKGLTVTLLYTAADTEPWEDDSPLWWSSGAKFRALLYTVYHKAGFLLFRKCHWFYCYSHFILCVVISGSYHTLYTNEATQVHIGNVQEALPDSSPRGSLHQSSPKDI